MHSGLVMADQLSSKPKKFFYIILGTIALLLGIIGLALPVIPTTPLILLAAWCYYRSSPRFHDWLINHPYLGSIIEEYSDEKGIKKESKIKAIILTWSAVLVTAIFIVESLILRILVIGLACIGTYFILRLKTRNA